jgi:hypothetical protein
MTMLRRGAKELFGSRPSIEEKASKKKLNNLGIIAAQTLDTEKKYGGNDRQQCVAGRGREECCR